MKATVPRFRYDQLMRLGWKIFLPISLIWVFLVSGWLLATKQQCPTDAATLASIRTDEQADRYIPSCRSGMMNLRSHVWILNGFGFNPVLFPMSIIFLISAMAETARAPFDLTEAESELVAGFQTEYSSMSFALFWLGEYGNVLLMCGLNAILFWGGWLPPIDWEPLYVIPGIFWFFLKIMIFFFIFSWVKATVPRFRYDQLMRLGWKIFLPISLIWVFLVSGYLMIFRHGALS